MLEQPAELVVMRWLNYQVRLFKGSSESTRCTCFARAHASTNEWTHARTPVHVRKRKRTGALDGERAPPQLRGLRKSKRITNFGSHLRAPPSAPACIAGTPPVR